MDRHGMVIRVGGYRIQRFRLRWKVTVMEAEKLITALLELEEGSKVP
jgi:hypothetical protein